MSSRGWPTATTRTLRSFTVSSRLVRSMRKSRSTVSRMLPATVSSMGTSWSPASSAGGSTREEALRLLLQRGVHLRQLLDETGALGDEAPARVQRRLARRRQLAQLAVVREERRDHEEVEGDEEDRSRGGHDDGALATAQARQHLVALPGAVDSELLLALSHGYGRGELDVIEPRRSLEGGDERARRARLPDQLHALRIHAEGLEPRV